MGYLREIKDKMDNCLKITNPLFIVYSITYNQIQKWVSRKKTFPRWTIIDMLLFNLRFIGLPNRIHWN